MKLIKKYQTSGKFDRQQIMDQMRQDIVQPNDGTIVMSNNPDIQIEYNPQLKSEGTPSPLIFEQQHPNLAAWGKLASVSPFIVASTPVLGGAASTIGSKIASTVGPRIAPYFTSPAWSAVKTGLGQLGRALDIGFAGHGLYEMSQGNFTPWTALEILPGAAYGYRLGKLFKQAKSFPERGFTLTPANSSAIKRSQIVPDGFSPAQYVSKGLKDFTTFLMKTHNMDIISASITAQNILLGGGTLADRVNLVNKYYTLRLLGIDPMGLKPLLKTTRNLDQATKSLMMNETVMRELAKIKDPAERAKYVAGVKQKLDQVPIISGTDEEFFLAGQGAADGIFANPSPDFPIGAIILKPKDGFKNAGHEARHLIDYHYPLNAKDQNLLNGVFDSKFFTDDKSEIITTLFDSRQEAYRLLEQHPVVQQILKDHNLKRIEDLSLDAKNYLLDQITDDIVLPLVNNANGYGNAYYENIQKFLDAFQSEETKAKLTNAIANGIRKGWRTIGGIISPFVGKAAYDTYKDRNDYEKD